MRKLFNGGRSGWNKKWRQHLPSGSDHNKSHMAPSWGTSCFRSMIRIWQMKSIANRVKGRKGLRGSYVQVSLDSIMSSQAV